MFQKDTIKSMIVKVKTFTFLQCNIFVPLKFSFIAWSIYIKPNCEKRLNFPAFFSSLNLNNECFYFLGYLCTWQRQCAKPKP